VLFFDGIARRPREDKLLGVFAADPVTKHELNEGLETVLTPHSRYNGLAEGDLFESGYNILARTRDADVDTFVRDGETLELFWQGHPEYDPDTLAREFRRDAARFARGEAAAPPRLPLNYVSDEAAARLAPLLSRSDRDGIAALAASVLAATPAVATWRASAQRRMRNFLTTVAARKGFDVHPASAAASDR